MVEAQPPVPHWPDLVRDWWERDHAAVQLFGRSLADWRRETRAALGLATDRPIVMTGHQADFWHPGILTKDLLNEALASRVRGEAVHLVVDQDANEPAMIVVPVRDEAGELGERVIALLESDASRVIAQRPAQRTKATGPVRDAAIEAVGPDIAAMRAALDRHANEANQAVQVARAVNESLARWIDPPALVFASAFMETAFGRALLDAFRDDARRAARLYNAAVRAAPEARFTELLISDDAVELPLWRIDSNGARRRAFARDLDGDEPLWPRALLMTGFARLVACDLFIHGTGGGVYDRMTEHWLRDWLGVDLAPMTVATTTMHLALGEDDAPSIEAARQAWRHAWHDPSANGERALSDEKAAMLARVKALPRGSRERREAFHAMHERLAVRRVEMESHLAQRKQLLERAQRAARERAIRTRRTWAFPLYPETMMTALRDACRALVARDESLSTSPVPRDG